jgi:hypothetical protein
MISDDEWKRHLQEDLEKGDKKEEHAPGADAQEDTTEEEAPQEGNEEAKKSLLRRAVEPARVWDSPASALAAGMASFWGFYLGILALYLLGTWLGSGLRSGHHIWRMFLSVLTPLGFVGHIALLVMFLVAARTTSTLVRLIILGSVFLVAIGLGWNAHRWFG